MENIKGKNNALIKLVAISIQVNEKTNVSTVRNAVMIPRPTTNAKKTIASRLFIDGLLLGLM